LQLEALAATPLRRMTYIAYFSKDTSPEQLISKQAFEVKITFMRGDQSEFRIEAFPSSERRVAGRMQLEGRDQRVAVPIEQGATYAGVYENFKWQTHATTSFWVDFGFNNIISAFENSKNGKYDYWPYRTIADLKDVFILVEVQGTDAHKLSSSFLRLNEDLVLVIPTFVNNRVEIRNILESIKQVDKKA
jgi:hypothetical protein